MAAAGCANLGPSERPVLATAPPLRQGVYTLDTVDVGPAIVKEVQAETPSALDGYLTGKATVSFTVDVNGKAADALVIEADNGEFGEAALKALAKWRFLPARVKSKPVPCRMTLKFFFDSPYGVDNDVVAPVFPPDNTPTGNAPATSIEPK